MTASQVRTKGTGRNLTRIATVIHTCITVMKSTTTIRDLRNHFPKVRKLVEAEGEVLLTEKGKPKYRLTLYTPPSDKKALSVDYWARLNSYQPEGMAEAQASAVHEDNRGDR
jgi:antitoxin (DNA-binding transcriptional repressor) of toxin-antitoxin stability system